MDELAYLRPSIFLKLLSSLTEAAVAPEIDVIRQRRSCSRLLACANTQKRSFESEEGVKSEPYTINYEKQQGKGTESMTLMLTSMVCTSFLVARDVRPCNR